MALGCRPTIPASIRPNEQARTTVGPAASLGSRSPGARGGSLGTPRALGGRRVSPVGVSECHWRYVRADRDGGCTDLVAEHAFLRRRVGVALDRDVGDVA